MNSIQRSILSTLALYAAEGRNALTLEEIYFYLHKSKDIDNHISLSSPRKRESSNAKLDIDPRVREDDKIKKDYGKPTEKEMSGCLSELKKNHLIFEDGDYYALENRAGFAEENIKKATQSAAKIRKNKWPLIFLRTVPFIRAIAITGSVAMDNATEKSDLDLLIVVKEGRIWTVRIFALLIIEIFGRRMESAKEKICLNFFTARETEVPIQNIAMANMLLSATPLFGGNDYAEFLNKNRWVKKFLYADAEIYATSEQALFVARLIEYCLNGLLGDQLENFSKNWQSKRLKQKITDSEHLNYFILTDDILMLHHPNPKNTKVMEKYNQIINILLA